MSFIDKIEMWVNHDSTLIPKDFRQATHIILAAIARLTSRRELFALKGGMLMALEYHSGRHTKDIDFSTMIKWSQFNERLFVNELQSSLDCVVEDLNYGLDCKMHKPKLNPNNQEATFPTLQIKIGYAYKESKEHARLQKEQSVKTVSVDLSFNESMPNIQTLDFPTGESFRVYSIEDLIAEKYRAMLQQEKRNRFRRQDLFDLHYLMENFGPYTQRQKNTILKSIKVKASSRGLTLEKASMDNPAIKERSAKEYPQLKNEITFELPDFEAAFTCVRDFYIGLPWD